MNATLEIRHTAKLLGWDCHHDTARNEDTFIYGPHMIAVDYRRDGTVDHAYRYYWYRVDDVQLKENTGQRNKKSRVMSWLASLIG